jgi:hypothetical protein
MATVRDVAQLGAPIGRTFAYGLLRAVSTLDDTSLQQALAVARRQQAKSLELRAVMSLTRLWQHQGT